MVSALGPQAVAHQAGEGRLNQAFGIPRRLRVMPEDTGGTFSAWIEEIPEGAGPPLHVHHDAQELFCVLEGRVLFRCSGRNVELGPGGTVLIPQHAEHTYKGIGPGVSRTLSTVTPGRFVGFFVDVEARGLTPERDMDRILQIARDYELEIVGPPI
jgi:mannose-6-phosphate isomerase-like protein (cupin superfamily)